MTYTDYPEADIATHREVAEATHWMTIALAIASLWGVVTGVDGALVLSAIALTGAFSARRMRRQADRWEAELHEGDER